MSAFFSQVFSLLTSPQGNFIYELVLAFSVAGALQPAYVHWRQSQTPAARRTLFGLLGILGGVALLFCLAAFALAGLLNPALLLPPVDRAVTAVYVIAVIWLWAFPRPSREADLAAGMLALLALFGLGLNLATRRGVGAGLDFNRTLPDALWQLYSLALVALGAGLLLIRRTEGYMVGLAFMGLAFLGHAVHLLVPEPGSYSGILRLAYMAAFPLLLTLSQRGLAPKTGALVSEAIMHAPSGTRRYGTDGKTATALLGVAAAPAGPTLLQAVARAIAHTLLADLGFVASMSEDKSHIELSSGFDLIREEFLPAARVDSSAVPRLANAFQRIRPLRLSASGTSADLTALGGLLDLPNPGDLLSVPIAVPGSETPTGLILLSPYSHRAWTPEDQGFLQKMADALAPILGPKPDQSQSAVVDRRADEQLAGASSRIADLERRNAELARQLEVVPLGGEGAAPESMATAGNQSEAVIEGLRNELEAARRERKLSEAQLEGQVNDSLRDLAHMQNQLAEANQKAMDLERTRSAGRPRKEQAEALASLSQELRQPMSSITGYTDLLLGESVGILGALQRKFIERIKASTERMGSLIDDMIQLNTLEVGLADLKPEAMDLNLILDNALAYTSSQVREKKISIHLDLPKQAPAVNADRDALQQILIHLLQNAGAATPMDGSITIKVQPTADDGQEFVMVQVTDSGGGIPAEDLPRVFTRLYRADNVLIEGVGDTGVGLSIAKTLTEAQHGRIWVESEPGTGATFNVLLPAVVNSLDWRPSTEAG